MALLINGYYKRANLGIIIEFGNNNIREILDSLGDICSNFDAEAKCIDTALRFMKNIKIWDSMKEK